MKKLLVVIFPLLCMFAFVSCEKAEITENEDTGRITDAGDEDDAVEDDDYRADDEDYDEGEFPLGSVVDVTTFKTHAIYTQVWVEGYIVGAATGAKNRIRYEFGPEFSFDTAILLSDNVDAASVDEAISVCLTSCSKNLRARLNLVDHPENKGMRIAVFGFQEKYLKIMGVKHIDAYKFPLE